MGIVWEAYHKGVPLLGVPENPTDQLYDKQKPIYMISHSLFWCIEEEIP